MKKVNIVIGRFQPFTKGHYSCVDAAAQLQMISRHNHRNFDEANFFEDIRNWLFDFSLEYSEARDFQQM